MELGRMHENEREEHTWFGLWDMGYRGDYLEIYQAQVSQFSFLKTRLYGNRA